MLLSIAAPATNQRGPLYMDQALAAIHQANPHRHPITFGFHRHANAVSLDCCFPVELRSVVEGQLYAQYPDCRIEEMSEETLQPSSDHQTWRLRLHLEPDLFPLKRS